MILKKWTKKISIFLVAVMFGSMLTACGGTKEKIETSEISAAPSAEATETVVENIQDAQEEVSNSDEKEMKIIQNVDGTEISVPVEVNRVGAIFGPSYEKIVLLGAEDKIICDGDFHINSWPWSNVIYKDVNNVPGIPNAHSDLNIEEMLGYDLDVVFNFPNPQTTEAMNNIGISVVPMASTGKLNDLKETVNVYAEALGGDAPDRAAKYAKYFDEKVKLVSDIAQIIPENERVKVYFANQNLLKTAGNQSDMQEVIKLAGGISVTEGVEGGSGVEVSREQLLEWDPDFIFVDHAGSSGNATAEEVIKDLLDADEYQELTAVKNDRVLISPTGVFFWDSGVQKVLLLMWIGQTMYPTYFEEIDMEKEVQYFYQEFFNYDLTSEEARQILAHENPTQN